MWPKRGKFKERWVFKPIFEGVKGATGNLAPAATKRAEQFWGHFGYIRVTLGYFRIALGSFWSHFGSIKVVF